MPEKGLKYPAAYCDGCFDILHYGHANQLRQAKEISDYLVVGIHSDAEITKNKKCAPVFFEQERYQLLQGLKWADKIVFDAPFSPTVELLDEYKCDVCVHGTDFSITSDGKHTFEEVYKAGRYVEQKRMSGISTTDIIQRVINIEDHGIKNGPTVVSPWTKGYSFLLTSNLIKTFSEGRPQQSNDKVVYVAGSFDIFHAGHLAFLQEASKLGTYLVVGVHTDATVKKTKGVHFPILSLHERVLNVLSYKCVSNVIIGAPYTISAEFMKEFSIDLVCHGINAPVETTFDPYEVPKKLGQFRAIDSNCKIITETIMERIINRRIELETRNEEKEKKERHVFDTYNNKQLLNA